MNKLWIYLWKEAYSYANTHVYGSKENTNFFITVYISNKHLTRIKGYSKKRKATPLIFYEEFQCYRTKYLNLKTFFF